MLHTVPMFRRFDSALMRPPLLVADSGASLTGVLRAWCEAGATPRLTEPLRCASLAPNTGLDAAACALDGSHALARLGRWQGLAWRLRILMNDQIPGRGWQPGDPWDCGWWREGPLDAAQAFRPRRATLLLLDKPSPSVSSALLAIFRSQSPTYTRPLRVVLVSDSPTPGVARLDTGYLAH